MRMSQRTKASSSAFANGCAVGDCRLSGDAQTKREKLLTEIGEVRVCHAAKQQLGASIEDFDVHNSEELIS